MFATALRTLALLAAILALSLSTVYSAAAALLPDLNADALNGTHVRFPADAKGKPFVLVVAYDRSASDALAQWAHKLHDKIGDRAVVFAVVDAAGAPFFVHGAIKSGVAKSAPDDRPEHRSNILITFDGRGWGAIAPSGARDEPAVIVADASGNVLYTRRSPYSEDALAQVARAIPQ